MILNNMDETDLLTLDGIMTRGILLALVRLLANSGHLLTPSKQVCVSHNPRWGSEGCEDVRGSPGLW